MKEIRAILFDMGGPLVDDDPALWAWFHKLQNLLAEYAGRVVSDGDIEKTIEAGVTCYAPSIVTYVNWHLACPDKALFKELRDECRRFPFEEYFVVRPGVKDLLRQLHGVFRIGLAANQRETALKYLEKEGLLGFFDSRLVSEKAGCSKPDLRYFQMVLADLKVRAEKTLLLGDRQDNDIVPARMLGMATVRLRVGFHCDQPVRYPAEAADYEIFRPVELLSIPLISKSLGG